MNNIKKILNSELRRTFPDILFFTGQYEGFWQCSWTDGPTKKQMEEYFKKLFPSQKLLLEYSSIEIIDGLELHFKLKPNCLPIRLLRSISPLRLHQIMENIEEEDKEGISHFIIEQYEEIFIQQGLIPSLHYDEEVGVYLSNQGRRDMLKLPSSIELAIRHKRLSKYNAKEKLMLSTLMTILGTSRVIELLDENEETVEEMFEAVAFSMYSDGS